MWRYRVGNHLREPQVHLRPLAPLQTQLERTTERMATATVIAAAIQDAKGAPQAQKGQGMSLIDKLDLIVQRRTERNQKLDARATALLDKYAAAEKTDDTAFGKHDTMLEAEGAKMGELEAAIDRLSNSGNGQ